MTDGKNDVGQPAATRCNEPRPWVRSPARSTEFVTASPATNQLRRRTLRARACSPGRHVGHQLHADPRHRPQRADEGIGTGHVAGLGHPAADGLSQSPLLAPRLVYQAQYPVVTMPQGVAEHANTPFVRGGKRFGMSVAKSAAAGRPGLHLDAGDFTAGLQDTGLGPIGTILGAESGVPNHKEQ